MSEAPLPRAKPTTVCIVESLRSTDFSRTGHKLFKKVESLFGATPGGMRVEYCEAPTEKDFLAELKRIEGIAHDEEADPLLHVECHGGDEGLQLGDDTILPWPRVGELFVPINEASRNSLSVVLAACKTIPVVQIFLPTKRAPFGQMIVSCRTVAPSEIEAALGAFYETLHSTRNGVQALRAMVGANEAFGYVDSPMILKSVYEYHLSMLQDPDYFKERARRIVDEKVMRAELPIASRSLFIDSLILEYRKDPAKMFRELAEIYFWLDRFPEWRPYFEAEIERITGA